MLDNKLSRTMMNLTSSETTKGLRLLEFQANRYDDGNSDPSYMSNRGWTLG